MQEFHCGMPCNECSYIKRMGVPLVKLMIIIVVRAIWSANQHRKYVAILIALAAQAWKYQLFM